MLISEAKRGNPIWEITTSTELSAFIRETGIVLTSSVIDEYFQMEKEEFQVKKASIIELHRESIKDDDFMGATFDLRNGRFIIKPY